MGFQGKPRGCDCPSKMRKIRFSNFQLLKPLKISRNFVYRAIKRYKEFWGVEDRTRSGLSRSVRTKAAINPLRKHKSLSRELNISPRSMSRVIRDDLHMRTYRQSKGHFLTPALKQIDGQEQSVSSSGMPGTGKKSSSSRKRKYSPLSSSTTARTTRCMFKHPVRRRRRFQGCREAITLPMTWFVVLSHHGVTPLHFCEKGVKTGARVYQKEL